MKVRLKITKEDLEKELTFTADSEIYVTDLKLLLENKLGIPSESQILILKQSKALLQNEKRLCDYGIGLKDSEECELLLKGPKSTDSSSKKKENSRQSAIGQAQEKMVNQYLNQFVGKNDAVKGIMESNPEIGQIMSDPKLFKENLEIASNPALTQEMMRGKDRLIQNVENHPEGRNVLQRMYKSIEDPLQEALLDSLTRREYKNKEKGVPETMREALPSNDAIPNPWAPNQPSAHGGAFGPNAFNDAYYQLMNSYLQGGALNSAPKRSSSTAGQAQRHAERLHPSRHEHLRQSPHPNAPHSQARGQQRHLPPLNFGSGSVAEDPKENASSGSASTIRLDVRFRSQLQQLQSMGFTDEQSNIRALLATGGNVEAAVNLLLS